MREILFALFFFAAFLYLVAIQLRDYLQRESEPEHVRAIRQYLQKRYGLSNFDIAPYVAIHDHIQTLFNGKGGIKSPEWEPDIAQLESQVQQPQRFHAMLDPGGAAWMVGYLDDSGGDAVARYCIDEERARWWAAVINLYDQAGHDVEPLFKSFANPLAVWGVPGVDAETVYVPSDVARPVPEKGRAIK